MYYIVRVKVLVENENGKGTKSKSENYLVEAHSVTEAEAIVNKDFQGVALDFEVAEVKTSRIVKILSRETVGISNKVLTSSED